MPLDLSQFKVWTEEEFERAFPPSPVSSKPNGGAQGATWRGRRGHDRRGVRFPTISWTWFAMAWRDRKDRSRFFMGVIAGLKERGFRSMAIFNLLIAISGRDR